MRNFILTLALVSAVGAIAQVPADFEVPTPKYSKIVTCTADGGVNVRKTPSTTAPKLVYNAANVDNFQIPLAYYSYWSTGKTGGDILATTFYGNGPLVKETAGWYEVADIGAYDKKTESLTNGWVSARYCSLTDVVPITSQVIEENPWSLRSINGGQYVIYANIDLMDGFAEFYVGKIVNGQLVCPYQLCVNTFEKVDGPTTFDKFDENSYNLHINAAECDDELAPSLPVLKDTTIRTILQKAQKLPKPFVVYYTGSELGTY